MRSIIAEHALPWPRPRVDAAARRARVVELRAGGATLQEIADDLTLSTRTVSRYVSGAALAHQAPVHGTPRRYRDGCRCTTCTDAHRRHGLTTRGTARTREPRPPASDATLDHLARRRRDLDTATRATATRAGQRWTTPEVTIALDPRLTTTAAARQLGRPRAAITTVRAPPPRVPEPGRPGVSGWRRPAGWSPGRARGW